MIKFENGTKKEPEDTDPVTCEVHGTKTTWGALDPYQRLAVEEGLDTLSNLRCILETVKV